MSRTPRLPSDRAGRAWLAAYRPDDFPPFAVTVDLAIFTVVDGALCSLLVRRGEHPQRGRWALPGGHVRHGTESAETAALRELREETGIDWPTDVGHLEQLATYSEPRRDPRIQTGLQVVTVAFVALAPNLPIPTASTDASDARWWPVDLIGLNQQRSDYVAGRNTSRSEPALAFDHAVILSDGLERVRAKLEYTTVATRFVEEPFTLSELRDVYTAVWGYQTDLANFRRKVLSVPQFVVPTNLPARRPDHRGGRPAALYVRGSANGVIPPLLREHAEGDSRIETSRS